MGNARASHLCVKLKLIDWKLTLMKDTWASTLLTEYYKKNLKDDSRTF